MAKSFRHGNKYDEESTQQKYKEREKNRKEKENLWKDKDEWKGKVW